MVCWNRIQEKRPPESEKMYLYRDTEGQYGVGVYETKDYFFNPAGGEVQVIWWAAFNKVEDT